MKKHAQSGAVTLVVTSILLICALVLALGSYKSVFYQIKRAQNEVKARQDYWKAEGGVECLYAYINNDPNAISSLSSASNTVLSSTCKNTLGINKLYNESLSSDVFAIRSETNYQKVNKNFFYGSKTGLGAIQTTADLRLVGSVDIAPDAPRAATSDGTYECVAVRYKGKVTFVKASSAAKLQTTAPVLNGPYDGFTGDCSMTHKTIITESRATDTHPSSFKEDYKQDNSLDPFKNYFDIEKTPDNIAAIKAGYTVVSLPTVTAGETCATVMTDNLTTTSNKLWIEGHCIIKTPIALPFPSSLVVENGIFSVSGSTVFGGSFYHMVNMNSPSFTDVNIGNYWADVDFYSDISSLLGTRTIYFDRGAFHPKGGMNFDADSTSRRGEVVLNGSYDLDYSAASNPVPRPKELKWVAGGWYAN
ncbi:hypothetical protein AB2S62_10950 [Vibrio sp. NTOU-M3]|uniref:hypothetical protein n=1 Tax=Vibrio sp. NTOU-M3 TaxID=3234954 RepID=UPI00349F5853